MWNSIIRLKYILFLYINVKTDDYFRDEDQIKGCENRNEVNIISQHYRYYIKMEKKTRNYFSIEIKAFRRDDNYKT